MRRLLALLFVLLVTGGVCGAQPAGFLERFALADDREAVLAELVPGTEAYYYYHALHYESEGRLDEADALIAPWVERHGRTPQVREIEYRQALLKYAEDPEGTVAFLKETLGIPLHHRRPSAAARDELPSRLDPALISRESLLERALSQAPEDSPVQGIAESAIPWLLEQDLSPAQRRAALKALRRADIPNLVDHVLADLAAPGGGPFGSIPIHGLLLKSQLDDLARRQPELLNSKHFVTTYLKRLAPGAHEDTAVDPGARRAHLARLEAFVDRLSGAHNSLKAHVLYNRLAFDRSVGEYDRARFLAYLSIPRAAPHVRPDYLMAARQQNAGVKGWQMANMGGNLSGDTGLDNVPDDTALVEEYLAHFFAEEDDYEAYAPYLEETYLQRILAETKLLLGQGDSEAWFDRLPAEQYQALRDRVDIAFAPWNPSRYSAEEPVALDVWVKNVGTLVVKVYEVNEENYYRQQGREVNTDIDLDGLVANHEAVHTYDVPPIRRVLRRFEFPKLADRGVYVVEFIGNGRSSRAVVPKGQFHFVSRTVPEGQLLTVYDESHRRVPDAHAWLEGQTYSADTQGDILVPFSTNPGRKPIILANERFASLDTLEHVAEEYALRGGIFIDRESLRSGQLAKVLLRASLTVGGSPAPLRLLEDGVLTITCTDQDGHPTTEEVRDFTLRADAIAEHAFRVPERLAHVDVSFQAYVSPKTHSEREALSISEQFALNGIDQQPMTKALLMSRHRDGYRLDLLDKTGLPQAGSPVHLTFEHRDFDNPVSVTLRTDGDGRIDLGSLTGIAHLDAQADGAQGLAWTPDEDRVEYPGRICAAVGETIRLPYVGETDRPVHERYSLLVYRAGYPAERIADAVREADGFLEIAGLSAGEYLLRFHGEPWAVVISVGLGRTGDGFVYSASHVARASDLFRLHVSGFTVDDDALTFHLDNATPFSKVHVVATRYLPEYRVLEHLRVPEREGFTRGLPHRAAYYLSGRDVGDEYQYILDRKYADKYPGNMLERPGLLLNPWAVSSTVTDEQEAKAGEAPPASPSPAMSRSAGQEAGQEVAEEPVSAWANLDFMDGDAVVVANLTPDAEGNVRIPKSALNGRQHVHVVAADPFNTVYRQFVMEETPLEPKDLRLAKAFDADQMLSEQREVHMARAGDALALGGAADAEFAVYDSVERFYRLFATIHPDITFAAFGFVTEWPELPEAEQRQLYTKYASHELSFFLFKKDPAFFETVVLPHLRNKRTKTYLDHWLLGDDLSRYRQPLAYDRLNRVEQVLLADRLPVERPATARMVRDLLDLQPPNVDRWNALFMIALRGQALSAVSRGMGQAGSMGGGGGAFGGGGMGMFPGGGFGGAAMGELALGFPVQKSGGMDSFADFATNGAWMNYDINGDGTAEGIPFHTGKGVAEAFDVKEEQAERLSEQLESLGYANGASRSREARRLYRQLDQTREWAENNYYQRRPEQVSAELGRVNPFWRDYAERDPDVPFLSEHAAEATGSFPEMMLALAVLDVPFASPEHNVTTEAGQRVLHAAGPAVVYRKAIQPADVVDEAAEVLVSEAFFRNDDRYRQENGEQVEKLVRDEFLTNVVYGCRMVVTNPTGSMRKLSVLTQVPAGAIPVAGSQYTRSLSLALSPYATNQLEYYFYFPSAGRFAHYPMHVSMDGAVIARAEPTVFSVVDNPAHADTDAWEYIAREGDAEAVLTCLKERNLYRLSLESMAWRLRDRDFYDRALSILRERRRHDPVVWAYAFHHGDPVGMREYLMRHPVKFQVGPFLDTPLLTHDPEVEGSYEHLEYAPLVNARVHPLGDRRRILNDRFAEQYAQYMAILACRPALTQRDLMEITYYLLLQERVSDAMRFFDRIDRDGVDAKMQYDYLAAYMALYREDTGEARRLAAAYREYPVDRWRERFAQVLHQVDEIAGAAVAVSDEDDTMQQQTRLAASEPDLEVGVESNQVTVTYQNIARCQVNYYLMDLELLFSRTPFGSRFSEHFSTIWPSSSDSVALPTDGGAYVFDLPERYRSSNVMVEVRGAGEVASQVYYANALTVRLSENYGQLQVVHEETGKPLSAVYVKAYARMKDGSERFYKDGYTDLRGRFDYASLSTDMLDDVDAFALLILSEDHGAVVKEAKPPVR